ncbi:MAG: hypothetical protein ABIV11_06095 [Gemmatimonadaceae bacterium]
MTTAVRSRGTASLPEPSSIQSLSAPPYRIGAERAFEAAWGFHHRDGLLTDPDLTNAWNQAP